MTMQTKPNQDCAREPLRRVETNKPLVALTFDDGPHPDLTPRLLDALGWARMRATFFVKGCFVREYPELVRRAVNEGHEIGNHTVHHPDLDRLATVDEVRAEIVQAQEIIAEHIGRAPTLFRAPCGRHDDRVWQVLDELGLPSVLLSVNPRDWDRANATAQSIIADTMRDIRAGDIVLYHDWQAHTADALPDILAQLTARGLASVGVSELLSLAQNG